MRQLEQSPTATHVLIYNGNGTSPNSARHAHNTLTALLGRTYEVAYINARSILCDFWEERCALLVIPGGRDLPYCEDLNGLGNARIRQYVTNGGRYFGLCAGAYYGSKVVEFEKGRPLMEVCGPRELGFYPGVCRGTAFPGFVYNSERGARSLACRLSQSHLQPFYDGKVPSEIKMYYNGGGYFVHPEQYDGVDVLCRFSERGICWDEPDGPAAVIHCHVGQGHAVLTSTHPEFDVNDGTLDAEHQTLRDLLFSVPAQRQFLQAVFARMGLNVPVQDCSNVGPVLTALCNESTLNVLEVKEG
ncbi:biotin holocarboxylase synthetase [Apophysomyces sp. BC1034]|nr:biotin holocarboxylase synthetase [Apophysomyces sp. BC1015]KAG0175937.1 biotin holocarboxylase synthetase [Apophysomyces sp. BC1021]KAG0186352.1 biotin holocarboxylase synthetase [Apophysomyces sp. BC1034]